MPIQNTQFGRHEQVKLCEFGKGDIMFSPCKIEGKHSICFSQAEPGAIGRTLPGTEGKSTDEIDDVHVLFTFADPKSVTALIHTLVEIQEEMMQ